MADVDIVTQVTSVDTSQVVVTQPDSQQVSKRALEDEVQGPSRPKAPKQNKFQKNRTPPEESAFYRAVDHVLLAPSAAGLVHLVDLHIECWKYQLEKAKIRPEQARKVLLRQVRECVEGYITGVNRKAYPDYRYFTEAITVELPPTLASCVGRLSPVKLEDRPDLVLDVARFLVHMDRAVEANGWEYANAMDMAVCLTALKAATSKQNAAWIPPLAGDGEKSLLCTGVYQADEGTYPVSVNGGSRRKDLLAGIMRLRVYHKRDNAYLPVITPQERNGKFALVSYISSSRKWTEDDFVRELFGPALGGERVLAV